MTSHALAPDDVVDTFADAAGSARPPLLVLEPLRAFLDAHGLGEGEIDVTPLGDGHSNVTLLVRRGEHELVVRRPPRPPLPPSAHDVLREARVLTALRGHAPVPDVLAVCDDPAVIGAPFYVMEKVEGVVLSDHVPAALDAPADRRSIGEELIDALARVHAVDWRACGLEGFGRSDGYLARQVERFGKLWDLNRTREVDAVDRIGHWLRATVPESRATTVVHGDFRLGNVVLDATPPVQVAAILDWEMATLGDPLADLGYLTFSWAEEGDTQVAYEKFSFTRAPGFPTRDELVTRYEEATGRDASALRWYQTLAGYKSIVFMEGNYKRTLTGASDDPYLKQFGDGVLGLARYTEELAFGLAGPVTPVSN